MARSVDVIIPCYRYGRFLRACVASVLAQDQLKVRVLIINDASPDDTAEVAAELIGDSRVSLIRHTANQGHIKTYNEGLAWAEADYLLLLSADDYLLPGALCRSVALMDQHPDVGFTFGNVIELQEGATATPVSDGIEASESQRIIDGMEFAEQLARENIVRTPTAVVRTALQKRVGGYRADLPHSGDMEMWLRFAAHGPVGFIKANQAVYRRHGANMSLEYMADGWLPDLHQRKAALDCFFEYLPGTEVTKRQVRNRLLSSLARVAVGAASAAFNTGQDEVSGKLSQFAVDLSPEIRKSLPWIKLVAKRRTGLKRWRVLQGAMGRAPRFVRSNEARPGLPSEQS